jgi:Spy/CpxP family protein refolding chaperone
MARPILRACTAVLFLTAQAAAAAELCMAPQQNQQQRAGQSASKGDSKGDHKAPQRPKWWIDQKLRAEFGISDQQSALVEQIWRKSAPPLSEAREKVRKLEEILAQLTRDDSIDEAKIIAQIEQVEQMRAEANRQRTLMIYRMNKILKPDQRAKVRAYYEGPQPSKRDSSR